MASFFSRFVCRVGGAPIETLDGLRGAESWTILDDILALETDLAARGEPLADALHERIGGHSDKARRRGLIELRRDVFNLRKLDADALDELATDLAPGGLLGRLREFRGLQQALDARREALDAAVAADLLAARRHLRDTVTAGDLNGDFTGALLLSSPALHRALRRYLRRPADRPRAKERQIERGLLRYLTRMAAKATPFATFCAILPGEIAAGDSNAREPLHFVGDPIAKRGLVRLNKAFLTVAQRHLVRDPLSRRHLVVTVNPTLRTDADGRLVFLSLASGREVFQRLPPNPALERLREILGERGGENDGERAPSAHDLVLSLTQDAVIDADEETIGAYVDRLIEIGFLQLGTGAPSQDLDWNRRFREVLANAEHPRARDVREWLADLEAKAGEFEEAPRDRRAAPLAAIRETVESFGEEHGLRIQVNAPLFEDATADARAVLRRDDDLRGLEVALERYVEATSRATLLRRDLAQMRHFFEVHYGTDIETVPLLDFYEDYYREHYKAHLEREAAGSPSGSEGGTDAGSDAGSDDGYDLANPFGLDIVDRIEAGRAALSERVAEGWAAASAGPDAEIVLDRDDLLEAVGELDPIPEKAGWSVAVFCDLVPDPEGGPTRLSFRRGRYTTGFGKMFSRFLDLFPDDFAEAVRAANDASGRPGDLPAELCDDANFNANLHPPLFSTEISYPPGEARGTGSSLLPTEIDVRRSADDPHCLELRHRASGRRVLPVDTGFMNPSARPPLYRLLAAFTPGSSAILPMPLGPGPHYDPESPVTVRPRVVFEDRLILYRRAFLVPSAAYPKRDDNESDADLFTRVERWRRRHGIPEQVYVRFGHPHGVPVDQEERVGEDDAEALDPETMKPQFIDFTSPLLVDLFARMAPERSFLAALEECLPARASRPVHHGRTLAAELILQLDFAADATRSG